MNNDQSHRAKLIEELEIAALYDSMFDDGGRSAAARAITAVYDYLIDGTGLPLPLLKPVYRLVGALDDVDDGRRPKMFLAKKVEHRPGDDFDKVTVKVQCAAAMSLLMKAGVKKDDAAKQVYRAAKDWNDSIKSYRTIANWRERISAGDGSKDFETIRYRNFLERVNNEDLDPLQAANNLLKSPLFPGQNRNNPPS